MTSRYRIRSFNAPNAFLLLILAAAGCTKTSQSNLPDDKPVPVTVETKSADDSDSFPRTVMDGLKRTVKLPRRPARIVSLAPKNTEELFAIGAGDRVVGVTSYCNFPAEALHREQIGGFSSKSISLEKIVALRPDLVVSAGEIHLSIIEELDRLKIPVMALAAETVDELYEELKTLGVLVGNEQQANQLVDQMQERVRFVRESAQKIRPQDRVSVFYMTWDDPLTAAGPKSYAGQMLEICGGVNVVSDVSNRYPQISHEVLLDRNPDVIITASMTNKRWTAESLRSKTGWQNLNALKSGRMYLLDGDAVSRCGPRLVEVLEAMALVIYPNHFGKGAELNHAEDRDKDRTDSS